MGGTKMTLASMTTGIAAAYACKIPPYDRDSGDLNLKGIITIILCGVDIFYALPEDLEELIAISVGALIGYVLFFYIIYGVMSLLKASGDNLEERRTTAFWVNAILSTALCFWAYG